MLRTLRQNKLFVYQHSILFVSQIMRKEFKNKSNHDAKIPRASNVEQELVPGKS